MNREERLNYAAECLDEAERKRFSILYKSLNDPEKWSVYYDFDEKWVSLEYEKDDIKLYFGSEK